MMGIVDPQVAEYRLARHYLRKLRTASQAVSRGHANLVYGLSLFDHEWPQIQYWQARSAQYSHSYDEWAHLCKEFPTAGSEVLAIRHTPSDRRDWWEAALEAARWLRDQEAERAILPHLAMALSGLGDLERTEHYTRQLFDLAHAASDPYHIGKALYHLGTILEDYGKHAEAERHYAQSLEIFRALGLEVDQGRALLGLGSIATITGHYESAYIYFLEYLEIVDTRGKESDLCIALLAVSEALRYLKRLNEMEPYLQRSIQLCRALDYQWALGPSLIAMGVCAAELGNLESAAEYLEEGVQVARTSGAVRDTIYGLSSLGYVRYRQERATEAIELLQEGLAMARDAGMPYFTCYVLRNLAYSDLALGRSDAAWNALVESLVVACDLGLVPEMIKTMTCAVAYASAIGHNRQSAVWAGFLMNKPDVDLPDFEPVCVRLEAALGTEVYQQLTTQGESLALEDVISEALTLAESRDQGTPSFQAP